LEEWLELLPLGVDAAWLAYARLPEEPPPRRWRGLMGYGRLDIAARVLLAALYPGGRLLHGDSFLLYLDAGNGTGRLVAMDSSCLPAGLGDEAGAGEALLAALRGSACRSAEAPGLGAVVRAMRRRGLRVVLLSERGSRLRGHRRGTVYVLGLRDDPPRGLEVDEEASVGPCSYLASSVAAYINLRRLLAAPGLGWAGDQPAGPRGDDG